MLSRDPFDSNEAEIRFLSLSALLTPNLLDVDGRLSDDESLAELEMEFDRLQWFPAPPMP